MSLKSKLASFLARCANRIDPACQQNLAITNTPTAATDPKPKRKTVRVKGVVRKITAQTSFKNYPESNFENVRDYWVGPIIAHKMAEKIASTKCIKLRLLKKGPEENVWSGELYVIEHR